MKHRICDRCGGETDSPLRTLCKKCWYELQEELGYQRLPYITNADRIRAMTDEELAKVLNVSICPPGCNEIWACEKEEDLCNDCWLDWLKQERDDNGT